MKYRKKPVEIYALQFFKDRWTGSAPPEFFEAVMTRLSPLENKAEFYIKTLEGEHTVSEGDFVIRGVKGEFYPCKPDIFEATHEPVTDSSPKSGGEE